MVETRDLASATWRFPIERSEDYKGTITFRPVRYVPPALEGGAISALRRRAGEGIISQFVNSETSSAENGSTYDEIPSLDATPSGTDTFATGASSVVDRLRGVVLYLPAAIQVNDAVQYEQFELGAVGAVGAAGMRAGQGAFSALARGVEGSFSSLVSLFQENIADQRGARLAAARLAEAVNSTAGGAVRSALATTVNPNTINLFKSVQLREFSFNFTMIANSPQEADQIENIVRFFRATMYPDTINIDPSGLNVPIGYEFPDKFQIEMRYNGEQVGVRILNSVLRSVQTNYNPQSMSWHKDGKPSEVTLSLNFGEERTLNRNDILQGY
jgi:hypothetical protein